MSKTIKSRIIHKHDIETNWLLATNFTPMNGEIIIYDEDDNYDYKRVKIGDGKTNVNQLPFLKDKSLEEAISKKSDSTHGHKLADLTADSTHRVVTDDQISTWNAKSNFSGSYTDLTNKPTLGPLAAKNTVAKTDLASDVQTSLGKADTALQSFTETDPTVPAWAKAANKPSYTASEVGAVPTTRTVNGKMLSSNIVLSASDVSAYSKSEIDTKLDSKSAVQIITWEDAD